MGGMNAPLSYQPSVVFFRTELRAARTKREAVEIGLTVTRELELLKEWVRVEHGLIPPRFLATRSECAAKDLAPVIPYASTEPSSAPGRRRE